jgi:hypothetical protein
MGMHVEPIRFLDLDHVEHILKSYMYGLAGMLYEQIDEKDIVGRSRLAEKKRVLLQSGILIPYLLWVYGLENVSRVFRLISQYLPIPTRPIPLFGADVIDETKETLRQAYIARTLTGRPMHLTLATGYEVPEIEEEDYGTAVHGEAEELFWALRPLQGGRRALLGSPAAAGDLRRSRPQAHHPGEAGDGGDRTQALPGAHPDLRSVVQRPGEAPSPRPVGEVDQLVGAPGMSANRGQGQGYLSQGIFP